MVIGNDRRVNRGDFLKYLVAFLALESSRQITAQRVQPIFVGDLVPELFDPQRRIQLALRPQKGSAFSASSNASSRPRWRLAGCLNEATYHILQPCWVRLVIGYE